MGVAGLDPTIQGGLGGLAVAGLVQVALALAGKLGAKGNGGDRIGQALERLTSLYERLDRQHEAHQETLTEVRVTASRTLDAVRQGRGA